MDNTSCNSSVCAAIRRQRHGRRSHGDGGVRRALPRAHNTAVHWVGRGLRFRGRFVASSFSGLYRQQWHLQPVRFKRVYMTPHLAARHLRCVRTIATVFIHSCRRWRLHGQLECLPRHSSTLQRVHLHVPAAVQCNPKKSSVLIALQHLQEIE